MSRTSRASLVSSIVSPFLIPDALVDMHMEEQQQSPFRMYRAIISSTVCKYLLGSNAWTFEGFSVLRISSAVGCSFISLSFVMVRGLV